MKNAEMKNAVVENAGERQKGSFRWRKTEHKSALLPRAASRR